MSEQRKGRMVVLALVVALVCQPMVGAAAASSGPVLDLSTHDEEEPDCSEVTVLFLFTTEECQTSADQQKENATHATIRANGRSMYDDQEQKIALFNNHLEDTEPVVFAMGKAEIIEGMRNGTSRSNLTDLNESVNDYYSRIEMNVIQTHERHALDFYELYNRSETYGVSDDLYIGSSFDLDAGDTIPTYPQSSVGQFGPQSQYNNRYLKNKTTTLANGTTVEYTVIRGDHDPADSCCNVSYDPFTEPNGSNIARHSSFYGTMPGDWAQSDTYGANGGPAESRWFYHVSKYHHQMTRVENQRQQMLDELNTLADGIYANYSADNFSGLELLDPITLVREFGTERNSTGYYGYAAAQMGLLGIEGNINSSWTMTYNPDPYATYNNSTGEKEMVDPGNRTISGTLYTNWDPNGNASGPDFAVNRTYNTSNTTLPVYFVNQTTANSTNIIEFDGEFTVNSLTHPETGEDLNGTSLEEQNYQSTNVSFTKDQMLQLLEYRQQSLDNADSGGSSGGTWLDGVDIGPLGVGLLGGVALVGIALLGGISGKAS